VSCLHLIDGYDSSMPRMDDFGAIMLRNRDEYGSVSLS